MKGRAHRLAIAAFLVPPLLYGCGSKESEKAAPSEEIFPVQVMTVQPGNMVQTISAVGTVRYRRETPLGFTTPGKVAVVRFEEGDFVRQGGAKIVVIDEMFVQALPSGSGLSG